MTGTCTDNAGNVGTGSLTFKYDSTPPTANLAVTSGMPGTNGWYISDVTIGTTGTDLVSSPVICTADQSFTSEITGTLVYGSCTNDAGLSTDATPITVKIDKTGPSANLAVTAGTIGSNGWYTSDVTIHASGIDSISGPVICTDDQSQTTETTGAVFNGKCTNDAGLSTDAEPLTVKLDKTGPSASLAAISGTSGTNGWYTSDATVSTSGSDSISSPVICTADQFQAAETTGTTFNGACTNDAGLATNAVPLTVKLDKTGPTATLSVTTGTLGTNGWYVSDVTVHTAGTDTISSPVTCTVDQLQITDTTGTTFNGACTNDAGIYTNVEPLTVKLDKTKPVITINSPTATDYLLNQNVLADWTATDMTSDIYSKTGTVVSGSPIGTGSVGSKTFIVTATDNAGNIDTKSVSYNIKYVSSGNCNGDAGHSILQPINSDGSSVFKYGSTVPAKFRVCDAGGHSIGTPGVVSNFKLLSTTYGAGGIDENVVSTTPDTAFRWDTTSQQWIFNMNTKNLKSSYKYTYRISLNDGSNIDFIFGLK